MTGLLSEFHSSNVQNGDINIHLLHNGIVNEIGELDNDGRPIVLFLHGFPEYHGAWQKILPLLASEYLLIAPDQRGYNLSSAPQDPEKYQTKQLVGDIIALLEKLVPNREIHLVGHDWGASIAYALTFGGNVKIRSLSIINGVHPITFQRALANDSKQAKASQYFHILSAPDAVIRMSENNFAKTFSMFEKFSSKSWLNERLRSEYTEAWGSPERLNAMLNWYRSSPIKVPLGDNPMPTPPLLSADPERFKISMPHQVIWGLEDEALLPVARAGLEEFAPDLELIEVPDAGHWINHTHPELVARSLDKFISRNN